MVRGHYIKVDFFCVNNLKFVESSSFVKNSENEIIF